MKSTVIQSRFCQHGFSLLTGSLEAQWHSLGTFSTFRITSVSDSHLKVHYPKGVPNFWANAQDGKSPGLAMEHHGALLSENHRLLRADFPS